MTKYYKKICFITSIVLLISFIGFIICLPLGIRQTLNIINDTSINPETVTLKPTVNTIVIDNWYNTDVVFKQSENETAYVKIYNNDLISSNKININYLDDTKVSISSERTYGTFSFDEDKLKKTMFKELQNYPDIIIYVPKSINIETEFEYILYQNIEFNNKEELKNKFEEKRKQQREEELHQREEEMQNRYEEQREQLQQREEEMQNRYEEQREQLQQREEEMQNRYEEQREQLQQREEELQQREEEFNRKEAETT